MIISLFHWAHKTFRLSLLFALLLFFNPCELLADTPTVVHDLEIWGGILKDPDQYSVQTITQFLENHSHWPQYEKLCRKAEAVIAKKGSDAEILRWFHAHPPQTVEGIMGYAPLLSQNEAQALVIPAWETMEMTSLEEKKFLSHFQGFLSQKNHENRLNTLLWKDDIEGAKRFLPLVSPSIRSKAVLRIAFLQGKYPSHLPSTQDEGLLYEIVKYYKKNKKWTQAAKILTTTPSTPAYADRWWKERHYIARELIELKNYKKAYEVLKNHALEPGTKEFAEAQWMLGWISLQFLKKPGQAKEHFEALNNHVKAALSKSRAAYWLGRAHEFCKDYKKAAEWYRKGARYITTFYGQLSAHKVHAPPYPVLRSKPAATLEERRQFEQKDLVKAAHILKAKGPSAAFDLVKVLTCLATQATTQTERELIVELTHHLYPTSVVWIARKAGNQEPVLLKMAYPVCTLHKKRKLPEKELLFSMAHKESDFNPQAVSPKGAIGLLQLMPPTAKLIAKELRIPHRDEKIFDPAHNLLLGATHVSTLLEDYEGSYVLVAAAYNAGGTPVDRWIKTFGHPHESDVITWIECIPYSETRNHVQRILENVTNYRSREGTPHRTIIDDLKGR